MATEQRLIDANALIEEMKDCAITRQDLYCNGYAQTFIENAPTVDAVEVVRCRDCEYGCEDHEDAYLCNNGFNGLIGFTRGDDFCSYGERRSDHV